VSFQRDNDQFKDAQNTKELNIDKLASQQSNFSKFSQNMSMKRPMQLGGLYGASRVKNPFMSKKMQSF